jgi:hypothetical protein
MRAPDAAFALCASAIVAAAASAASVAPQPSLDDVLERAGRFVEQHGDTLQSVRADEDYIQQLQYVEGSVFQERHLRSEVAFVRLPENNEWLAFRNVTHVDGIPTGADPGRLAVLVRERSSVARARQIADESASYNIGPLRRNLNIPTVVLQFLLPQHQRRFKFRKRLEERGGELPLWVIDYEERERPTIVRTVDRKDVPVAGRLWIVPSDGRVARATLLARSPVQTEMEFRWQEDARLGLWVPAEMRELYRDRRVDRVQQRTARPYDIRGVAKYSNYRRFDVEVKIR